MPVWAAVVIGLASGLFSTLAATMLTIRHERESVLRTEMLSAAQDYVLRSDAVVSAIKEAIAALDTPERDAEVVEHSIARLAGLREDALRVLPRIQLLFGSNSRTWGAITEADTALEEMVEGFQAWPEGERGPGLHLSNYARKGIVLRPLTKRWLETIENLTECARLDIARGSGSSWLRRFG